MVFIEERYNYLTDLEERPKQKALCSLLFDQDFKSPAENISESDSIYFLAIQAIKSNSKDDFYKQYCKISKRKVSENTAAPFVHDDFLIFTLIIGILIFENEKKWILGVIGSRAKSSTTTTFENILTGNYQSKSNIQSLVLVFLFLCDKSKISNELLIEGYNSICDTEAVYNNDFIRIIHYRAFDLVIQYKLPRDTDKVSHLLRFETKFKKRVGIFSYVFYNALLLFSLMVLYMVLHALPEIWKSNINEIGIVIGIAGVGLFGNVIPICRLQFQKVILNVFGYQQ